MVDTSVRWLADIPVHLQVNLSTSSFVEKQEEGGSKCAQCDSGQVPHLPVAVGTRLRKPTAISGFVHLREEGEERSAWETNTQIWTWKHTPNPVTGQHGLMQEVEGLQVILNLIQSGLWQFTDQTVPGQLKLDWMGNTGSVSGGWESNRDQLMLWVRACLVPSYRHSMTRKPESP